MSETPEELPAAAKLVLDAERQRPGPSASEEQAVLERLIRTNALAVGASAATITPGLLGSTVLKVFLGTLVGAAAGGGVVGWRMGIQAEQAREELAEARRALVTRDSASAERADDGPVMPTPVALPAEANEPPAPVAAAKPNRQSPAARPEATASAPAAAEPREVGAESIAREAVLIDRARTALLKRDVESAQAALLEYQERFPTGRMIEEQELMMVQLHLARGRRAEAERAARRFRELHPNSLFTSTLSALFEPGDGIDAPDR